MPDQSPSFSSGEAAVQDLPPANLLWTSGWDSTFRLLTLVLEDRRAVQPYYVIDRGRPSWRIELETQDKIRAAIAARDPAAADLIRPTIVVEEQDIAPSPEVTERYLRLAQKRWIGGQYEFLARLVEQHDIQDVELSVLDEGRVFDHLQGNVEEKTEVVRLKDQPSSPDLELFRRFAFPLLGFRKSQMRSIARERGFADILNFTWFCHTPQNGRPCGRCNPCLYAMKEGFAWRIPLLARVKSWIKRRRPEVIQSLPAERTANA